MRLHHAWHDDVAYSPIRRVGEGATCPDPDDTKAANTTSVPAKHPPQTD